MSLDDQLTLSCVHKHLVPIYINVESFRFSKDYKVDTHNPVKHNTISSRINARVFVPKYIVVENKDDFSAIINHVDHGIRAIGNWVSDSLYLFSGIQNTLDLRSCGITDVSPLSHVKHTLNLSDNLITDVVPLAKIERRLFLRNNYIVDAQALGGVKKDLDLRDNYLLDASFIRHISGV
jgi:hypothetical protein